MWQADYCPSQREGLLGLMKTHAHILPLLLGCHLTGLSKSLVGPLHQQESYTSELLSVERRWQGAYQPFGSAYTFAILHTVTNTHHEDDEVGLGCEEYLVFFR